MSCDAVVFGNGLGTEAADAVERLMKKIDKPVVVDASALSLADKSWLNEQSPSRPKTTS